MHISLTSGVLTSKSVEELEEEVWNVWVDELQVKYLLNCQDRWQQRWARHAKPWWKSQNKRSTLSSSASPAHISFQGVDIFFCKRIGIEKTCVSYLLVVVLRRWTRAKVVILQGIACKAGRALAVWVACAGQASSIAIVALVWPITECLWWLIRVARSFVKKLRIIAW